MPLTESAPSRSPHRCLKMVGLVLSVSFTQVVLEQYLREHKNPTGIEYDLCGPPMMIKACIRMMENLGVPLHPIAYDEF